MVALDTSGTSTAAANTTTLQAALTAGGRVYAYGSGVAYVNSTLTIGSNTNLEIAKGLTLKLAPGSNCNMIRNASWGGTVKSVTTLSTADQMVATCVVATAHGLSVGGYALILGASPEVYNDCVKVLSVSTTTVPNDTFTFRIAYDAPYETLTSPATGTITVMAADSNIRISGAFDFNGTNQSTPDTYDKHGVYVRRVHNFQCVDASAVDAIKYPFLAANAYSSLYANVTLDTASDGVHFDCSGKRNTVSNIRGKSGDDCVGILQGDYPQYKDAGWLLGYIDDLLIENVKLDSALSAVNLLPSPASGSGMGTVRIRGVGGRFSGGAAMIKCLSDATAVNCTNGIIQSLEVEGLSNTQATAKPLVSVTCQVISLRVSGVNASFGNTSGQSVGVLISGTFGYVGALKCSNWHVTGGANSALVYCSGLIGMTPGSQYDAAITLNNITGKTFGTGVVITSTASFNGMVTVRDYYVDSAGFVLDMGKPGWTMQLDGYSHAGFTTQAILIRSTANSGMRLVANNLGKDARGTNLLNLTGATAGCLSVYGFDIGVPVNDAAITKTISGQYCYNTAAAAGTLNQNRLVTCNGTNWIQVDNSALLF